MPDWACEKLPVHLQIAGHKQKIRLVKGGNAVHFTLD